MSGKLIPCPFCGGVSIELRDNGIGDTYAICYSNDPSEIACGARTSDAGCETDDGAIRRWNRRALLPEEGQGLSPSQSQPCADVQERSPYTPSLLDRAIYIAAGAHSGQIDKGGAPYIHHVLRVMQAMDTEDERIVAVLHDLLEDCPGWSVTRLDEEGFPNHLVLAIKALTRGEDEGYDAFIRRVAKNPLAASVKRADLMDNMDLTRLTDPGPRDYIRVAKYERSLAVLSTPLAQLEEDQDIGHESGEGYGRPLPSPSPHVTGDGGWLTQRLETAEAALRTAGVCMSCWGGHLPSGDPNGCTDCLNTGFAYGQPDLRWRREIVAFADIMERKLRENDHKGGWAAEHQRHLFRRMQEEADELALAIYARTPWSRAQNLKAPDPANVGREAADVANFAMMIADVCGALTPPATPALGLIEGEQGSSNASPSQPVAGRHGPEADQ